MTADNKDLTDKIRLILIIRCYIRPDFNYRIKFSTFINTFLVSGVEFIRCHIAVAKLL